jgi:hypothetical protein
VVSALHSKKSDVGRPDGVIPYALYSDLSQKYLVPKHSLHEKPSRVARNLRFIAINATAKAILHGFLQDCKEKFNFFVFLCKIAYFLCLSSSYFERIDIAFLSLL